MIHKIEVKKVVKSDKQSIETTVSASGSMNLQNTSDVIEVVIKKLKGSDK